MSAFSKINGLLERMLSISLVSFGALMVALLTAQVIGRYIFSYSAVWIVEVGQYSFVWVSMLGMALTYRRKGHVALDYDWHRRSRGVQILLQALVFASVVFVAGCISYGGFVLTRTFGSTYMPGLGLSMAWVNAAPLLCGGLMVLFAVEDLLKELLLGPQQPSPDQPTVPRGGVV